MIDNMEWNQADFVMFEPRITRCHIKSKKVHYSSDGLSRKYVGFKKSSAHRNIILYVSTGPQQTSGATFTNME